MDSADCVRAVNKGNVVLPKSTTNSRIEENLKTIKLDSSEMETLESLHKKQGVTRFVYPAFGVSVTPSSSYVYRTDPLAGIARIPRQGLMAIYPVFNAQYCLEYSRRYRLVDRWPWAGSPLWPLVHRHVSWWIHRLAALSFTTFACAFNTCSSPSFRRASNTTS